MENTKEEPLEDVSLLQEQPSAKKPVGSEYESGEPFQAIFEHSPIGIAYFGLDFKFRKVNRAMCDILGYSEAELTSMTLQDLIHPDDLEQDMEIAAKVLSGEMPIFKAERKYLTKDKKIVWTKLTATIIKTSDGEIYSLGLLENITEQKHARDELEENERRFRTLAYSSPVGIFETDEVGNCTFVNDRWCQMSGLSPDEAMGMGWLQVAHPDDKQRIFSQWAETQRTGREFASEHRLITPSGEIKWIFGRANSLKDANGTVIGFIGTDEDITERKLMEERLIESELRYRRIVEQAVDGIVSFSPQGFLIDANPKACEMIGYTLDELMGITLPQVIDNEDLQRQPLRLQVLREGKDMFSERVLVRKDGTRFSVEFSARQLSDHTFQGIFRDISERKRAEKEREDLIQQLKEALAEVKTLSGMLPICASCKNVRDDSGYWKQIETYISEPGNITMYM